jgi:hypothetical protein
MIMAKKKIEKKELTVEERLEQEKQHGLSDIEDRILFINEPSYYFNIDDKVRYGAIKESIIDEIYYDGKVYGLKCIATNNNYGHPYDYETYRVVPWVDVRPLNCNTDTNFSENQDVRLNYNNATIESLLDKHYLFGVDFNPEYQRDYVWSKTDKELLIDSIFKNIDIGKFVFIHLSDEEWKERHLSYEILDGKQRLSTLIDFYENKLSYKGKYYNDLSPMDKRTFKNHMVSIAEVRETNKKIVLKYFLMLNRTGKVMDEQHLGKVEKMLDRLE